MVASMNQDVSEIPPKPNRAESASHSRKRLWLWFLVQPDKALAGFRRRLGSRRQPCALSGYRISPFILETGHSHPVTSNSRPMRHGKRWGQLSAPALL